MTRYRVLNEKTGRMVYKTGPLGKKIMAGKKASKKKSPQTTQKKSKCITCPAKKKGGPVAGKCYAARGSVKTTSVMKITNKGHVRLSARAAWNAGWKLGTRYSYGGQVKVLKMRANGSPYWGACN